VRLSLRTLTNRWKLKLTALALAILLWVVVSAEQVTTQWISVRVDPVVSDPGYVLVDGPDPAIVQVRFRGPGRELWELALDQPSLVLPVRSVGNARNFALDPAMVRYPEGVRGVEASDVRPALVRLDLQRQVARTVPVSPRMGPGSAERFVLDGPVRVSPATVQVVGPQGAVDAIDSVRTAAFELAPGDSVFSHRVRIDTAGLRGISVSAHEVEVGGRVDRRVDRAFAVMPLEVPAGYTAAPGQVEGHVTGRNRAVGGLTPNDVRAVVPADSIPRDLPPGGAVVRVRIEGVPEGAAGHAVPPRVRVIRAVDSASVASRDAGAAVPPAAAPSTPRPR
jgi:hypothetical protein